jgi:DUF1680 family protein
MSPHLLDVLALTVIACALLAAPGEAQGERERAALKLHAPPDLAVRLAGPMGERVERNIDEWLLPAVDANPRMIEMFRTRDRQPVPDLVPWAGEFVGKYLISAIQAARMSDRPELRAHIRLTIAELLSTQAEDGYLGPFRQHERLLGHWDLWGHYHIMLALLMWYEETGDEACLQAARRMGDLICNTFLDTGKRVIDADSTEMNMAVIHSLGWLYRETGDDRYLRMMREIEKDWESAGDYFRTGAQGIDYFRTPKPRWESLHDLQGLVELYRISGDDAYRRAYESHWTTILQHDVHPTGGFSTNEQAVGNPYSPGAIETCCTTAWVALSVDMLRLTGDSRVADALELSTWNSVLGSQHPSGRWWTYDTPVNGVRQASAHHIVFQARFGTPELNCCSVNAPRGIGAISEWAVLLDVAGPLLSYYGPGALELSLADGTGVTLTQETAYPAEGDVKLRVGLAAPATFDLRLRIPSWSKTTRVAVNGTPVEGIVPGTYLSLKREWREGDEVDLAFDMSPRYWTGELMRQGMAAVYRGPLLLAFDPKYNAMDTVEMPALDAQRLDSDPVTVEARFQPLVARRFTASDGRAVVLCDFATAGAHGTDSAAWLPVVNAGPAPLWLKHPRPGEAVAAGPLLLEWTAYGRGRADGRAFSVAISRKPDLSDPLVTLDGQTGPRCLMPEGLPPGGPYYWQVTASNPHGSLTSLNGPQAFTVDATLANTAPEGGVDYELGEHGLMVASPLAGTGEPTLGVLDLARDVMPAPGRDGAADAALAFNGQTSMVRYRLPYFPEQDYTFTAWICPEGLPNSGLYQIFSAWCAGMDDPLRVCIQGAELFARIEARGFFSTPGVALQNGEWVHVAAVKQGAELRLYVNGEQKGTAAVPEWNTTAALDFAIGANPHWTGGNETFQGRIADIAFYAEALTAEQLMAGSQQP